MRENFTKKLVTHIKPSMFRQICEAAHDQMMTPSNFVRIAIAKQLEAKQTAPARRAPRSRQAAENQAAA